MIYLQPQTHSLKRVTKYSFSFGTTNTSETDLTHTHIVPHHRPSILFDTSIAWCFILYWVGPPEATVGAVFLIRPPTNQHHLAADSLSSRSRQYPYI